MITQIELYNTLVKHLKDNAVDFDDVEDFSALIKEIDDFSNTIRESSDKSKKILDKLSASRGALEKISKIMGKMAEDIEPAVAAGIYERANTLKNDIDLFEIQILSKLAVNKNLPSDSFHGLRSKDYVNIFLAGEFSSGKTTFIRRLIAGLAGHISSAPSTACLVIHKNSNTPNLVIVFNREIHVQNHEIFEHFLNSYDLRVNFTDRNDIFISNEKEKVIDNWSNDKILSFLKDANAFPEAFAEIIWNHNKKAKKNDFLNYAYLFDMPGFGGDITGRHDTVIENIFKVHKPDVVLYLINPDRGIPSDEEVKALPKLLHSIIQYEIQPLFCWVYQKPDNNSVFDIDSSDIDSFDKENIFFDVDFLTKKRKVLKEFLDDIANGEKYKGLIDQKHIEYLSKSFILDARGPEDDTETAQNAVSLVLQKYFYDTAYKYYERAKEMLSFGKNPMSQQNVMFYRPENPYASENPFINKMIIEKIKTCSNSNLSVDYAKGIFSEAFGIKLPKFKKPSVFADSANLDDENLSDYPFDLRRTLKKMKQDINVTVDIMINTIRAGSDKVSIDSINKKYWTQYKDETSWQSLLFTVQAYHWLKASYDGLIDQQYISGIGSAILTTIKRDIERLNETKLSFPMVFCLEER